MPIIFLSMSEAFDRVFDSPLLPFNQRPICYENGHGNRSAERRSLQNVLPWREASIRLLENRVIAKEGPNGLKRRFSREQECFIRYSNIIRGYFSRGHTKTVTNEELKRPASQDIIYLIKHSLTLENQTSFVSISTVPQGFIATP